MTKSGAGEDPFADDTNGPAEESEGETVVEEEAPRGESRARKLPYIHSRSGYTDGRETRQLHMRPFVIDAEEELQSALRKELGEKPKIADVREMAMLEASKHVESMARRLRKMGYGQE